MYKYEKKTRKTSGISLIPEVFSAIIQLQEDLLDRKRIYIIKNDKRDRINVIKRDEIL